jgi:hypothetical protein
LLPAQRGLSIDHFGRSADQPFDLVGFVIREFGALECANAPECFEEVCPIISRPDVSG